MHTYLLTPHRGPVEVWSDETETALDARIESAGVKLYDYPHVRYYASADEIKAHLDGEHDPLSPAERAALAVALKNQQASA